MTLSGINTVSRSSDGTVISSGNTVAAYCGAVLTGGGAAATAVIRDGGSSGRILATLKAAANTSFRDECCVAVNEGNIYVDLTGTGAVVDIRWK